ncbi:TetR/AcrR family transcriptional regulator [Paenibacillus piri]|uniref:TetR/AcrR family transcriptional regulator n=1 Tax=Paenibacillus piri TaxID=2547395 RepID=A0A4R5KI47_9BACL|nr:TetR/AcrR family transcriptional regulator [Paenibacillus piri]TDF95056.1 TetR/AcrR family transcriptional regulator [Paenibacillus piri]
MDETIRLRIIQSASDLFNQKGYKSVSVSDLAARLGMSKKTIYLYFSGKEQIAEAVLDLTMNAIARSISEQTKRSGNPLYVLEATFKGIKGEIVKLNPLFLEDMQKYAPALWNKLEAFRGRQLRFIEGLLTKAKQDGHVRDDVNIHLATVIMLDSIQRLVRPDFAARHNVSMVEVADTLFALFLQGLYKDRQK